MLDKGKTISYLKYVTSACFNTFKCKLVLVSNEFSFVFLFLAHAMDNGIR